jgi:type I restriction enzyme S subunit
MKTDTGKYPLIEFAEAEKKLLLQIIDGDRGLNYPNKTEMSPNGYCLFLNTSNIKNDTFDLSSGEYITLEKDLKLRKGKLIKKDIVLTTRGTVGSVAHYKKTINQEQLRINSGMVILRVSHGLDDNYFYQVVKSDFLKSQFYLFGSGSAQPQLPIKDLRKISFPYPPRPIQRKIAAVLSAYDDLIENNNRRIAILEKMAEELYREWFVRLRFPGHEKTKITKGVPEGWEVKTLGEICFEERNLIKKKNISDETRYIGLEHISPRTIITKDYGYAVDIQSDKLVFSQLDILFGKIRPYLHKVSIAHFNGVCSSDIIVIKSIRPENQAFVYLIVSSNSFIDLATTASTGTKMPRADWDFLIKQKIIYPEIGILKQFQKIFDNSLSAIFNYQKRNEMLQHSRDRLLSRLMSGKIDVENLDIQFPDSMKEEAVANA